uniref:Uncharacterized protein n=1 Tax=Aegilops tauschii subsp. strangulata TaxID=200361 RepID=A0A453DF34_AEGTS
MILLCFLFNDHSSFTKLYLAIQLFGKGNRDLVHFNMDIGQIRVDYAMNAFSRKTLYFSINSGCSGS